MAVCLCSLPGRLGLAFILCCCCCWCCCGGASNAGGSRLPHPLLYFDPGDARVLQQQAHTTHAHLAKVIRNSVKSMMSKATFYLPPVEHEAFAARWNEIYGNNLGVLAIYCVLFPGDETALRFTLEYVDRMCSYPRWQVRDAPHDEVPVAHSLVGVATAYDFLYPRMDARRRAAHLAKIRAVTAEMFELSKFRAWGKHYLHNHQVTNAVALLTGALVVEAHDRAAAAPWRRAAAELMERTMSLLDRVVDGSLDEGVAYGSYTSRSVTQYIFLALRHFGINHTNSTWLREHFWFYYATALPGYQRTVGIADSNYNWFYGPESQLAFLDRYVLRNGSGNWLAQQIRRSRPRDGPMEHSTSQRWCTLHTEYLWYDAQLVPRPPADHAAPRMHLFSNWGVVTYGGGLPRAPGNTFVSFKSGKLGGRAVFEVAHGGGGAYPWINGWKNFNPGHEHPDQNSFTFAPNGQAFVAEALYGPKHTYLNNALVFGPSPTSQCNQPWEGQLGECFQWLKWTAEGVGDSAGEVITASQHGELVFTAGEAAPAYSSAMGLESVYRSLLLLNSQTLLVVDHIERSEASPVSQASAFFHNMELDFKYALQRVRDRYNGAVMDVWDAKYEMFWFDGQGNSPRASLQDTEQAAEFKKRWTQFVNVTFALGAAGAATRVAYVFHGPFVTLGDCRFVDEQRNGVRLQLEVNGTSQLVSIATRYRDPAARLAYLGFAGYAKLENERQVTRFGLSRVVLRERAGGSDLAYLTGVTVSFAVGITLGTALVLVAVRWKFYVSFNRLVRLAMLGVVLLWFVELLVVWRACVHPFCGLGWERRRPPVAAGDYGGGGEGRPPAPEADLHSVLPTAVVTSLPASGAELLGELFGGATDFAYVAAPARLLRLPDAEFEVDPFVDACEWTYADVRSGRFPTLQGWFQSLLRNPRLHLQNVPLRGPPPPKRRVLSLDGAAPRPLNGTDERGAPGWDRDAAGSLALDETPTGSTRSRKLLRKKQLGKAARRAKPKQEPEPPAGQTALTEEEREAEHIRGLRAHLLAYPNTRIALHLTSGSWNLKLPFLRGLVGSSLRALYVVRDPRAWVYSMLYGSKPSHYAELDVAARLERLFQAGGAGGAGAAAGRASRRERCGLGSGYAFEFEPLRRLVSDGDAAPVALLAHAWLANTAAALRVNRQLPAANCMLVRFEELVQQPQAASERIYGFLGMPLPPAALNRVLMATRSRVFRLPNEGPLSPSAVSAWKAKMPRRDIREIEDICASMMTQLGYSKFME